MKPCRSSFVFVLAIFLILSGCTVNSPLIKATQNGNFEEVKKLIRSGANVNEPDKYGITPLMHSIYYRHTDMAKYFIESGANVNARDLRGYNSLLYAVESDCNYAESADIIKLLIKKGADVNAKDSVGETAIDLALSCARSDIFDDLTGPAFNLWSPETGKARVFFVCNDLYDYYVIVTAGKQHKMLNQSSSAGVAFIDVDPGKNIIDANFNKSVSDPESIDTTAGQTYYFLVKQNIVNRFVPSFYLPANANTKDFTITHLKEDAGKRKIIEILRLWRENPEIKIENRHYPEYEQDLRDLKKLKEEGAITEKEYEQKRKDVIDKM